MTGDLLPASVLQRTAIVYVRQSTQAQVQTNLESQRRQYELVETARQFGFRTVEVIDCAFQGDLAGGSDLIWPPVPI